MTDKVLNTSDNTETRLIASLLLILVQVQYIFKKYYSNEMVIMTKNIGKFTYFGDMR